MNSNLSPDGESSGAPEAPRIPDHELLRFIASGSFGSVWLARNIMQTFRAVKVVFRANFKTDHDYEREFGGIQKFEPVSRTHDDLIDILQIGRNDEAGYFYYVMEVADDLVSGQEINANTYEAKTLDKELERRGRLPFEECLRIGLAVSDGLRHLNEHGLIHRDIKPANIIFVNGNPKIADIGLVTEVGQSHSFVGTPGFMAPEGPWTVQADIYSLGKVLYEISFGKDRQAFPAVPTELQALENRDQLLELNEIITKACDGDIRRRYQTAAEMHADLVLLQGGESVKRLRELERWRRKAVRIGAAAAIIGLIGAGFLFQARRSARDAMRRLADSYVKFGAQSMSRGDLIGSLPWFTEALRLNLKTGDAERATNNRVRIASMLRQCPRLERMWFHDRPVLSVDVSPDGRYVVAGQRGGMIAIWELGSASPEPRAYLRGHTDNVLSVAYSKDGTQIVSASSDRTARVWDASEHTEVGKIQHTDSVFSARLSHDGLWLVTTTRRGAVTLWEAQTRQFVRSLPHNRPSFAVFDREGDQLLTASLNDGDARIWKTATGEMIGVPFVHGQNDWIYQAAFNPDGHRVATASFDKTARIWDTQTGLLIHKLKHAQAVRSIRFSSNGNYVLTACDDLTARLWNVQTGEEAGPPLKHSSYLHEAVFSPDGRRVVTATVEGIVSVWDLSPNDWRPSYSHDYHSGDGSRWARIQTNSIQLYDAVAGAVLHEWTVTNFLVAHATLNHDGSRALLISSRNAESRTQERLGQWWDTMAGTPLAPPFLCDDAITNACLSPDGRRFATFHGGTILLGDVATGLRNSSLLHDTNVLMLCWDGTSRFLLSVTTRSTNAWLWDAETGNLRTKLHHDAPVSYAEFSPDGSFFVTTCTDDGLNPLYAQVWRTETGRPEGGPLRHGDGVLHATFSSDGYRLVTSSEFKTAEVWDWKTGEPLRVFPQADEVFASAFSPSGKWVAAACRDGTAQIFETESGNPVTPKIKLPWGARDTLVRFVEAGQSILLNRWQYRQLATADFPPDNRNVETLALEARILSSHRSDETGNAIPLTAEKLRESWMEFQRGTKPLEQRR